MLDRPDSALFHEAGQTAHICVADLIDALRQLDPKAPVMVGGPYGGFVDVCTLGTAPVRLNVNNCEGFGPHDLPGPDESPEVIAVIVGVSDRDA